MPPTPARVVHPAPERAAPQNSPSNLNQRRGGQGTTPASEGVAGLEREPGDLSRSSLIILVALLIAVLLGGCNIAVTYFPLDAAKLRGRSILLLQPERLGALTPELHARLVERIEAGIVASPHLGAVLTREALAERLKDLPKLRGDYAIYSSTLALGGVASPEAGLRLGRALKVELLAMAQVTYLPCPPCEQGDQMWLLGEVIDAGTGDTVLRVHLHTDVGASVDLEQVGSELADEYLGMFREAFAPKWHRQRFESLRVRAAP